ncbi:hypothetical protein DPMN_135651 [Dreissena polymorpha]|uniref:Uncharacterized protein n=1 Tax=Dreissena polymorpha TaxID=45954 RepID=A0A9D4FZK4_DREPO|nr:hypothetical protein DPMN_135651 [Dreissena polymorpha]
MTENDEKENTQDAKSSKAKYNKDVTQTEKLLIVCQVISGCVIFALVAVIIVLVCRKKRPSQDKMDEALYVIPANHGSAPPRYETLQLRSS